MPRVEAILFDLDGTIADSAADIRHALEAAFAAVGMCLGMRLDDLVDGRSLESIFEHEVAPSRGAAEMDRFIHAYRSEYARDFNARTRLYPGVAETLARFRPELRLAVATSKPTQTARRVVDALGIGERFIVVRGTGGTTMPEKPAPDLLLAVAAELGVAPANALMVGDTPRDVLAGHNAGMLTAAATWGMAPRAALVATSPHHVLERFDQIEALATR